MQACAFHRSGLFAVDMAGDVRGVVGKAQDVYFEEDIFYA